MSRNSDRKEQLLDVASELFSKYGLEGTTTKDIAREAGVSPGLLYHYYSSKEELFCSLIRRYKEEHAKRFDIEKYKDKDLESGLKEILGDFRDEVHKHRDTLRIVFRTAAIFPSVKEVLEDIKHHDDILVQFFMAKCDSGELAADFAVDKVASILAHIVVMSELHREFFDLNLDSLVHTFLYGIKGTPHSEADPF
ncbi:TetR/AcrR family transcriptional regulator [bacterium]|nr:TetR/AcrR family transcriptional regulator [bacterium]